MDVAPTRARKLTHPAISAFSLRAPSRTSDRTKASMGVNGLSGPVDDGGVGLACSRALDLLHGREVALQRTAPSERQRRFLDESSLQLSLERATAGSRTDSCCSAIERRPPWFASRRSHRVAAFPCRGVPRWCIGQRDGPAGLKHRAMLPDPHDPLQISPPEVPHPRRLPVHRSSAHRGSGGEH
jgi:hypothetical protein